MKRMMRAFTAIALLFCMTMILVPAQEDAQKRAEGRMIFDKMIDALGGYDRLANISDSVVASELKVGKMGVDAVRIVSRKRPGRIRVETKAMGMNIIMAFNGKTGWIMTSQVASPLEMPSQLLEQVQRTSIENEVRLDPERFGLVITYEGRRQIGEKSYLLINQTYNDGYEHTVYIDPDTYLPYKTVALGLTEALEMAEMEAISTDYRDVDGTKVPFSVTILQDGREAARFSVIECRYNSNLDDLLFEKP